MATASERIKELRISLGYSVDEFAKLINVHRSSIYRYEGDNQNESRDIPISVAVKICEKFSVSMDWLSGSSDIKYLNQTPGHISEIYDSLSYEGKKEAFSFLMYIKSKEENK